MKHQSWIVGTMLGLTLSLTACKKERDFTGIWRTEIDSGPSIDIHNVMFFSDLTASWQDSIFNKTDSSWQTATMGGAFALDGNNRLNASFSKKIPSPEGTTVLLFQYTFHKQDNRQLYCDELDTYFKWVHRLR